MNSKYPKFLILLLLCTLTVRQNYASDNKYDVGKIPLLLRLGADAVVRNHSLKFTVKDESSAVLEETLAVTVFNKNGQNFGRLVLWYDNFKDIDDLDGTIYDDKGEEIRDLESRDIRDRSAFDGYSLYEESRVRVAELYYDRYPYTVEFKFEIDYDGYISWPSWYSRTTLDAVELTSFEVNIPENYNLRYWCNIDSVKPVISNSGTTFLWKAKDLQKLSKDAAGEDIEDVATIVKIAPTIFEIDGSEGSMRSWKDFGSWAYKLYDGRDVLPEDAVREIKKIASAGQDIKTSISKLYKYMQSRTRYVSVQLGIGAWQPFDAAYVHERGYGDCKALSNYMVSILEVADIKAYPVLINNGSDRMPLIKEFPSNQFNHVIVCVPTLKDTVWLECTNENMSPGSIGWSNENRGALMLTHEGGKVVSTPTSRARQNFEFKKINVRLLAGRAELDGKIKFGGDRQVTVASIMKGMIPSEQERWLLSSFEVPDIKLKGFRFEIPSGNLNEIDLDLKAGLTKYASVSGRRLFFYPNLVERRTYAPAKIKERLSPIRFKFPYADIDSVIYTLPDGYKVEAVPDPVNLTSSFGEFHSNTKIVGENNLLYVRSLKVNNYSIPAENYDEYRKFFEDIVQADRMQVVLVRK